MTEPSSGPRPYADAAELYWQAGWRGILPLPIKRKKPPPDGYTGEHGKDPSRADVQTWVDLASVDLGAGVGNIALRLPDGVIGIDVDAYDGKQGAQTLTALEERWGPLPATWTSSSRSDGSSIRFYQATLPPYLSVWPSDLGPGVEVIQRSHRYAVVWPSVHPEGRPYRWTDPRGATSVMVPAPGDLTHLTWDWTDGLEHWQPEKHTGWTDAQFDSLVTGGIPHGEIQDETLARVVWRLRSQEVSRESAYAVWQKIARHTVLTRVTEPWTRDDFDRHWKGADAKQPAPLAVFETARESSPERSSEPLLKRSQLRNLPIPEPLIENTVDRRTVCLVSGYWGTLKSFIAIDWAACVATGKTWLGRPVQAGSVLYVAAEGAYGVGPRLDAWEYAWRSGELIDDDMFAVYPRPVNLLEPAQAKELVTLAAGRRLVVIDTLARCLVGGDENSAQTMGIAVDVLYRVRDALDGGTVVVLHHTGKDKTTTRGSSALEAGVDTVYQTEGTPAELTLTRTKRKDGPVEDTRKLEFGEVGMSGIIRVQSPSGLSGIQGVLANVFRTMFWTTGATKAELKEVSGMPKASFYEAFNALISGGHLATEGTGTRAVYHLIDVKPVLGEE